MERSRGTVQAPGAIGVFLRGAEEAIDLESSFAGTVRHYAGKIHSL